MKIDLRLKGALIGAIGAAAYGLNPLFTLPLYQQGMTTDIILFYRYLLAVLLLGGLLKIRQQSLKLPPRQIIPAMLGSFCCAGSSLFLFLSYLRMEAGIASSLLFVYPVMVAVIMSMFYHEKTGFITISSIVLALTGIALLYGGGSGGTLDLLGCVYVMLSALLYAIFIVGVKQSRLRELKADLLTFWTIAFGVPFFLMRMLCCHASWSIPVWWGVGMLLLLALLPTVVAFSFTALSIRYVGPTPTAILGALEPVTAVVIGILVFHENFTLHLAAGVVLIIVAVILVISGKTVIDSLKRRFSSSRYGRLQRPR